MYQTIYKYFLLFKSQYYYIIFIIFFYFFILIFIIFSMIPCPLLPLLFLFFLYSSVFSQTIVPAGLGAMNANQPDRNTAVLSGNLLRTGGQNPTVKIVWGDEDRGANASALSNWDNTVTISTNQDVGAFSTTITIPNQEKIIIFDRSPRTQEARLFPAPLEFSILPHLLELQIYGDGGHSTMTILPLPLLPVNSQGLNYGWTQVNFQVLNQHGLIKVEIRILLQNWEPSSFRKRPEWTIRYELYW